MLATPPEGRGTSEGRPCWLRPSRLCARARFVLPPTWRCRPSTGPGLPSTRSGPPPSGSRPVFRLEDELSRVIVRHLRIMVTAPIRAIGRLSVTPAAQSFSQISSGSRLTAVLSPVWSLTGAGWKSQKAKYRRLPACGMLRTLIGISC